VHGVMSVITIKPIHLTLLPWQGLRITINGQCQSPKKPTNHYNSPSAFHTRGKYQGSHHTICLYEETKIDNETTCNTTLP
jgi:hypothetical protein